MSRSRYNSTVLAPILIALIAVGAFGALAPIAPVASTAHAQTAADPAAGPGKDVKGAAPAPIDNGEVYGELMAKIMSLFAWLLGAATLILDYAVYYGVVVMGDFVNKLSAIGVTWRILRDIGNIMLIFGFIASGIMVIINVDKYGFGSKMLPALLVAAVFLNFSLFVSEAIIDVNNLFATQIYQQINGGEIVGPSKLNAPNAVVNEGISNRIMSVLGLPSLYDVTTTNKDTLKEAQNALAGSAWYVGFMGIILFIVASFVMFSLAFVIIARFVALVFLIAVAPIGFAGLAIPQLKGLASKWWSQLFEQAITAPVLLLLLYIALAVITDANFLTGVGGGSGGGCDATLGDYCGGGSSWTGFLETAKGGTGRFAGILFSFIVAMGLLLAVVVFAKRMSAFGAGVATKMAGKATFGAVAFGARSTVGWAAQSASRGFARTRLARMPVIGRGIAKGLGYGAKSSFDIRGTSALKNIPFGGIDAGAAQKGGYRKTEEEAIKEREAYAKTLQPTKGVSVFGKQLWEGEKQQKEREEQQKKTEEGRKQMMQQTIKDIQTQNDSEMRDLRGRHQVELQPYNARVDTARREQDRAESAYRVASTAAAKRALDSARTALNNELRDREREVGEQRKEQDELKRIHDQMVKVQQTEVDVRQAEVEARQKNIVAIGRQPQERYAAGLEWGPGQFMYRNQKAAANIKSNAGKSKEQKDVDTLMDMLKKTSEPRPSAPPPAPPAGGGGGPP